MGPESTAAGYLPAPQEGFPGFAAGDAQLVPAQVGDRVGQPGDDAASPGTPGAVPRVGEVTVGQHRLGSFPGSPNEIRSCTAKPGMIRRRAKATSGRLSESSWFPLMRQ